MTISEGFNPRSIKRLAAQTPAIPRPTIATVNDMLCIVLVLFEWDKVEVMAMKNNSDGDEKYDGYVRKDLYGHKDSITPNSPTFSWLTLTLSYCHIIILSQETRGEQFRVQI